MRIARSDLLFIYNVTALALVCLFLCLLLPLPLGLKNCVSRLSSHVSFFLQRRSVTVKTYKYRARILKYEAMGIQYIPAARFSSSIRIRKTPPCCSTSSFFLCYFSNNLHSRFRLRGIYISPASFIYVHEIHGQEAANFHNYK